ncbi:MAG TPA: LURP-one-related family protein [Caproiciproducens sp.]|jgi:Uncharacterized conserved protein|nr:LURP-one-related family protein [Caproiciproducens sp.]
MQLYIQQSSGTKTLFTITDSLGQPVYRVTGDSMSIGSKIYLIDNNENEAARIFSVGVPSVSKYSVFINNKERARVLLNLTAARRPVKIKGASWRFRGSLLTRSYDIISVDSTVVMSHGCCWNVGKNCFAAEITNESDVLLCLCIAVILDSTVIPGSAAALPVG